MLKRRGVMISNIIGGRAQYTPETFPFTLDASDSFNRANGAPGNTDGAGTDGVTGGSGKAWVDKVGTSTITTNRLRFSAVTSNVGITTVDTGKIDGIVMGKFSTVAAVGLCLRYVNSDNYVRAYIVNTGTVYLVQVVGGTPATLLQASVTYVADAEIVVTLSGRTATLEYNGAYYGFATLNAVFDESTLHGIYANVAGSTVNCDQFHFITLPAYQPIQQPSILQTSAGKLYVTAPMQGDATRCVEWDMRQERVTLAGYGFTSNVRRIHGMRLVTIANGSKVNVSTVATTSWESAGQIGADADIQGDYNYFGGAHQSEQLQTITIAAQDVPTLPRWKRVYASQITIDQTMNTIYPKDKVTAIGTTTMRHLWNASGLTLTRSHTYSAGYRLYNWYGAMMPVDSPVVDYYKVGDNADAAMVLDDGVKNLGTQTASYKAWKDGGNFTVVMSLPTGGPDNNGDWSKSGNFGGWFKDNAAAPQKFYINYVDGDFADCAAAVASSHTVQYWIESR